MSSFGGHSMYETLRAVLVRPPDAAFGGADPERWHYAGVPDLAVAQEEHSALVEILRRSGAEVVEHREPLAGLADAVFVHDPALITDAGAIVLRMGKELRRGEEDAMAATLAVRGIPVTARIEPPGTAEGGDLVWLRHDLLAAGLGFRTNREGIEQLTAALAQLGVTVLPVPLPYGGGPTACLHLMSLVSVLDSDLAVAFLPLLPVPFVGQLRELGFAIVEVPEAELATMGPNVLATAPRRCVALRGNPITRNRLQTAGCSVVTYRGDELSLKAEGGPTCLTRPIWRSEVER